METEPSPKQPEMSNYLLQIHQVIRDGQYGLISFEDARAVLRSIAKEVLSKSEKRQCMFDPTAPSSPDRSSEAR